MSTGIQDTSENLSYHIRDLESFSSLSQSQNRGMRKTRPLSMKKSSTSERMNELIDPPTKRNSFFRINKNPKKNVSLTQRAFTSQGILRNKEKTTERVKKYLILDFQLSKTTYL